MHDLLFILINIIVSALVSAFISQSIMNTSAEYQNNQFEKYLEDTEKIVSNAVKEIRKRLGVEDDK